MKLLINGETQQVPDTLSVAALLKTLGYDSQSIAVAVDGTFVPRHQYTTQTLKEAQTLDIVAPMQGG
ncbi:sulfur carrier protein ThiS [Vampirovibrio sp.]|uniref:sulfur carrier protein ThiS n=1 Tax=Vampirovibrio sp. TaxID=2717857 RepID=UPI0035943684